jgi:hypothetical protein
VISELVMVDGCGIYGRMGGAPAMSQRARSYVPAGLVGREQSSGHGERAAHRHARTSSVSWPPPPLGAPLPYDWPRLHAMDVVYIYVQLLFFFPEIVILLLIINFLEGKNNFIGILHRQLTTYYPKEMILLRMKLRSHLHTLPQSKK